MVVVEQAKPPSPRNCSIEVQPRIQLLSNFRVSFGNDAVKTFIYEKESEEATPILHRQSFTELVVLASLLQGFFTILFS